MSFINYILGIPAVLAQVSSNSGNTVDKVTEQTGNQFAQLIGSFFAAIPLWIAAIVIAFASYLVALAVKKSIELKMSEKGIEEEHKEIQIVVGRTSYFVVLTIGITISLSIVGIDLKPIVAAGAFGLGFALQDIIMNTISGMFILISKHFTIGDVIVVGGVTGKIEEIQTRATIIKDFDGQRVIVPNSSLFKNVVVSKTSNPYRKLTFLMGVGYWEDLKQVVELTLAVVNTIPGVLKKPKASVMFTGWGDSSIDFKIKVWIDSKGGKLVKVKNRVIMDLSKAYDESGIDVPYPIQTLNVNNNVEEGPSKEDVKKKIKELKAKYKARAMPKESPANGMFPLMQPAPNIQMVQSPTMQPQIPQENIQPIIQTQPISPIALAPEQQSAPVQAPVQTQPLPALPVAINTTPNSPGQSWLQQALAQQVAATQPAAQPQQASTIELPAATPVQSENPPVQPQATTIQPTAQPAMTQSAPQPEVQAFPTPGQA